VSTIASSASPAAGQRRNVASNRSNSAPAPSDRSNAASKAAAGLLGQTEHERDRKRAGGECHHDAGDHHRLRYGIEGKRADRAAPRDDAEDEEYAAADQVEGEQLLEGLRNDMSA
jgi:hypothetical protein